MSTHKHFDKICCVIFAFTLLLTVFFINAERFGIKESSFLPGYESRLFDTSTVHTIDIVMDNWDEFIANCKNEEYYSCAVVIDNEAYKNVGIRAKGNTSLTQVESYGNNRYSFKIEFDHYDSSKTYYGLDKLCLNNIIQDNTYMKDYLTYQMMAQMGVAAPLCSYVNITVNGEDWGLYLAVEGIEEAFLQRNYGTDYGKLYKPDSTDMGGGRGNGERFDMDEFLGNPESESTNRVNTSQEAKPPTQQMPNDAIQNNSNANGQIPGNMQGGDDVLLKYINDDFESYSNIFDNAKTDISDNDKTRLIEALKRLSSGEELARTVDIDAVIRYFVVHNFVLNFDSYTGSMVHNYYLYEDDGQMQMIPWDYNLAFGGFESMSDVASLVNYPIDSPVSGGNTEDRPMLAWIFSNEEYTERYHECFSEFITAYFDSGNFQKKMDRISSMIAPYVEKDPTKFCTYEEFKTAVSTLNNFCLLRSESIKGQLDGTIGATKATQNSDSLIDAGDLQISDMGTMNHSMDGGGMEHPGGNMQNWQDDPVNNGVQPFPSFDEGNYNFDAPQQTPLDPSDGTGHNAADGTVPQMPRDNMQSGISPERPNVDMEWEFPTDRNGQTNANGKPDEAGGEFVPEQTTSFMLTWLWTAISISILVLGIVFAFRFRRRKQM